MNLAIIDYGSGNLHSAAKAFERAAMEAETGHTIHVTADPDTVRRAERIVLPGVGAYADCWAGLNAVDGMIEALEECVTRGGKPFLGICVGMQLLSERGHEYRVTEGLGWIKGEVRLIEPAERSAEDPAYGLEYAECEDGSPAPKRHTSRERRLACLFCAFIRIDECGAGRVGRRDGIWWAHHGDRRQWQCCRYSVSPGKKSEAGPQADCKFSSVAAVSRRDSARGNSLESTLARSFTGARS